MAVKTAEYRLHSLFTGIPVAVSEPSARQIPEKDLSDVGAGEGRYAITFVPRMIPQKTQGRRGLHFPLVLDPESDVRRIEAERTERRRLLAYEIGLHRTHLARLKRYCPEVYESLPYVDDIRLPVGQTQSGSPLLLGPGDTYRNQVETERQRLEAVKGKLLDAEFHRVSQALKPHLERRKNVRASVPELIAEQTFPASPPMRELKERIVLEPRLKPFVDWVFVLLPSDAVRGKYQQLLAQLRTGGPHLSSQRRKEWRHGMMSTIIHEAWPLLSDADYSLLMTELRRRNYPTVPAATEEGITKVLEGRPQKRRFSIPRTDLSKKDPSQPVQTQSALYTVDTQSVRRAWIAFRNKKSSVMTDNHTSNNNASINGSNDMENNKSLHSDAVYGIAARSRLLRDAAFETHRDVVWMHPRFALMFRQFDAEPGERRYAAHDIPMLLDAAFEVMRNSEDRQFPLRLLLEERNGLYEVVGYATLGGTMGKVARYHVRGHNKRILERAKQVLEEGISWSRRKIPLTRAYGKTDFSDLARRWVENFDLEGLDELSEAVGIGKPRSRPTAEMIFADIVGSRTLPDVAALLQPLGSSDGLRVARQVDDQYRYPTAEALSLIRHAYRRVRGKPSDAGLTVGEEADVLELATEIVNRPGAFRFAELSTAVSEASGMPAYAGRRKIRSELPDVLISSLAEVFANETVPVDEGVMQELLADFFHSPVEGVWNNRFLLGKIQDPRTPAATQRSHLAAMLENFARHEIEKGTPLGIALVGIHLPVLSRVWADTDFLAAERVIGKPLKTPLLM